MTKRFAIPLESNVLSAHLWHAREIGFMDAIEGNIMNTKLFTASCHELEFLPGIILYNNLKLNGHEND